MCEFTWNIPHTFALWKFAMAADALSVALVCCLVCRPCTRRKIFAGFPCVVRRRRMIGRHPCSRRKFLAGFPCVARWRWLIGRRHCSRRKFLSIFLCVVRWRWLIGRRPCSRRKFLSWFPCVASRNPEARNQKPEIRTKQEKRLNGRHKVKH